MTGVRLRFILKEHTKRNRKFGILAKLCRTNLKFVVQPSSPRLSYMSCLYLFLIVLHVPLRFFRYGFPIQWFLFACK